MRAITFVEMVVSLLIIALISTIVLVSYTILERRKLEVAARGLVMDLCWVREAAANKHLDYIVDFDTAGEIYSIYEDRDEDGNPAADEQIKQQRLAVDLVSVTDFTGSPLPAPQRITFDSPYGVSQERIVNLSRGGKTKSVNIYAETGYVVLEY